MPNERVALLVRLAPELKLKLVELAKRQRRSLSKQVEVLLEESLLGIGAGGELADREVQSSRRTRRLDRKAHRARSEETGDRRGSRGASGP